jgi:hypothetical protein
MTNYYLLITNYDLRLTYDQALVSNLQFLASLHL